MPKSSFVRAALIAVACATLACASGHPHTVAPARQGETRLSAAELQADLAVLRRAYEQLHPGLYRYNTPARMNAAFAALATRLDHEQTLREAYLAISQFLARVRCGHSYANFVNQPAAVAAELFQHRDRVPYYFRWVGRRMVVTRNFSTDSRLAPGTEVLAIDGVPAARILDRLMTIARADGANDAKRIRSLSVVGEGRYETFDVYFPMFFPRSSRTMRLDIRDPAGRKATLAVTPLDDAERFAPVKEAETARHGGDAPAWTFALLDSATAILRMPTWALYDSRWNWKGWLDSAFRQLDERRVGNLVIDLRGNEGGQSVGDEIIARVATRDVRPLRFRRLVRYRRVPADLVPFLDTWDPSFRDWGAAAVPDSGGFYRLRKFDVDSAGDLIRAAAHPYSGRLFVLVDASNSSATFEFASAVRREGLGTLVGQTTGGSRRGINGGAFFFLRLPNSRIEVDLPLIGYYPPEREPDAGLVPDVRVDTRAADIASGRDAELAAVRALIAR